MAPEYRVNGELSQKCDVYSFGVVLLEIVSGRRSIDRKLPEEQIILSEWVSLFLLLTNVYPETY